MNIKRITAALLAALICLSVHACKGGEETTAHITETVTETEAETETGKEEVYDAVLDVDVRPVPAAAEIRKEGELSAPASLLSPSADGYGDVFALFGFSVGEGGLPVIINIDGSLGEEEYKLTVKADGIGITASGRRGVFAAVSTLAQLECDGRLAAATIEDGPAVAFRGVIEGFYGTAWTHRFRLDLFSFMGKYKLNTYIYAPKDDPKHRSAWRSLYTGNELEKMRELIDTAAENNVRFVYALSPGLDIDLGAGYEKDFQKLADKCESMYGLGVRDFAILLDDIPTLDAEGHAKLCNDFQSRFVKTHDGCSDLIMISPEFCAAMLTGYTNVLAPLLDPDIMVMWTGNYVLPQSISAADLKDIDGKFGRNVFIWWNYPVNDTMANQLFMGPCVNLAGSLYKNVSGLVSNPMNQGYASRLPLVTIADYLWNPSAYDPEASISAAVKHLDPECADGLYGLMDLCRGSSIIGGVSTKTLSDEIKAYYNKKDGAARTLLAKLEKMKTDLSDLYEKGDKNMTAEIKPWLDKALAYVDAAILYLRFDISEDEAERGGLAVSFAEARSRYENSSVTVSPDVLAPFLSRASSGVNAAVGGFASSPAKLIPSIQTYDKYVPSYALDGDESTFYWSAGAAVNGSTFTVDLGEVTGISGIRLLMGADGHADDYVKSGVIEYSSDGKTYTYLCDTAGRKTENGTGFSARYVRVRCTKDQIYWVIISEFYIRRKLTLPGDSSFDGGDNVDLSALFDKDLFSTFRPSPLYVNGKTLKLDVSDAKTVTMYITDPGGLRVYASGKDGTVKEDVSLSPYTVINVPDASYLNLTFGPEKTEIAEIVIK